MEKATSAIRRSGAYLLSYSTGHQELNMIVSDIKILKSQLKALRDTQQTILQDNINWTCVDGNRALQELFLHLSDLNSLWVEVQSNFVDQISEFKRQYEMILEGEKTLDAARNKLNECEQAEEKAVKKLKKAEKKKVSEDINAAKQKLDECRSQKELSQTEVSEKVKENEAVKLIRVKGALLKLSEAILGLSKKCIYIFEAQRDIVKSLPDVEDKEIHEIRFDGLSGAKDILQRAQTLVKEYSVQASTHQNTDPPPPYSPHPFYATPPFNPYLLNPNAEGDNSGGQPPTNLYPSVRAEEDVAVALKNARI